MSIQLSSFIVFDYLKVHEIVVEPKRMKATYTLLKKDGETVSNTLIYAYTEKVFDSARWEDRNLAATMAVQVALNYGLFCDEIIFEGAFDEKDQSFLRGVMENTSREIYVHKLLGNNEFLRSEFSDLVSEKKSRYTAAKLIFQGEAVPKQTKEKTTHPLELDDDAYIILSSGGKDSLLSYGILNELHTAHPIYVNESGRHWYTAYNAYHKMLETEPNTSRVWCNCDRIFNWMVRQMPFIRENYQNIRADIYPIRLWTVSVFLFGVLPLARKRKVRNLIIGNEYDTTLQLQQEGITHYAALYDQSKYFDNALTRYYDKKGWNFFQFSILRSLSELLILKILVKRYPDLQSLQVSCHAAHKEGERMNRNKKGFLWEEMTWEEIKERLETVDTVLLPCGAIEQHGPHLPVDIDYYDAKYLAHKVAEACSDPKPLVLPAIPYGVSYHHEDFAGTISVTNNALSAFVYDIGMNLAKQGVKKIIIINGHGDNAPTLNYAAQMINRDARIFVCVDTGDTSDTDIAKLASTPNDIHAGEIETSTTLALRPEAVQMDKAVNETLDFSSDFLNFDDDRSVSWYVRTSKISNSGIMGDATIATAEKGVKMWDIMIHQLVKFVEFAKKTPLEKLYQSRH